MRLAHALEAQDIAITRDIFGAQSDAFTEHDQREIGKFTRFLRGEMDPQERAAYAAGEPMTSANAETMGMGC